MSTLAVATDRISAGPLGLLVVLLMFVATVLLIRNMNRHLRKLPREFPPPHVRDASIPDPRAGDGQAPNDS